MLITVNEDDTKVTKHKSKTRASSVPSVDIKPSTKYHEEIVMALIHGALPAKDNEVTLENKL